jgi:hypothetical protein
MQASANTTPVSLERLERAQAVVAYCLLRCGPAVQPILERFEREVAAARLSDPMDRARRILEAYTDDGGLKAIALKTSALLSSE